MNKSILMVIVAVILIGGLTFFVMSTSKKQSLSPEETTRDKNTPSATVGTSSTDTSNATDGATFQNIKTFEIEASNFLFSLKEINVNKGETVRIVLTNKDGIHDLVLDEFDVKTKKLQTGQSDTIEFVAGKSGAYEYYCSVANHRQMGMVGKLIVN